MHHKRIYGTAEKCKLQLAETSAKLEALKANHRLAVLVYQRELAELQGEVDDLRQAADAMTIEEAKQAQLMADFTARCQSREQQLVA